MSSYELDMIEEIGTTIIEDDDVLWTDDELEAFDKTAAESYKDYISSYIY